MKHRINLGIARMNRQQGYTLIEIVIGLAIAALVLGAAAYYGKKVFDDQKVTDEVQRFNLGSNKLKTFYSTSANTLGIASLATKDLIKIGALTDESANDTVGTFKSKLGGTFGITTGTVSTPNDGFVWTYQHVPESNCVSFAKSIAQNVPKITIGTGTSGLVKDLTVGNTTAYDESKVVTGCTGDDNTIAITFQKN